MPLSDSERRRLEALERDIDSEDPRLALKMQYGSGRIKISADTFLGSMTIAIGVVVLLIGVAVHLTIVGVTGFLLMYAGTYWIVSRRPPHFRSH